MPPQREVEALRAIGPPTVPELYEAGELADGPPYLVMEFIPLPLLADRLAQPQGPLPGGGPLRALALTEALDTVHRRGFIHCDLKPENLFLDDAGRARAALRLRPGASRVLRAPRGTLGAGARPTPGTAEYMAPEQCAGPASAWTRARTCTRSASSSTR